MRTISLSLLLLLLTAASAEALKVKVVKGAGLKLDAYQTYAWKPVQREPGSALEEGSPLDRIIRQEVEKGLERLGLQPSREGEPHLLISYEAYAIPREQDLGVHKHIGPFTWVGVTSGEVPGVGTGLEGTFTITLAEVASGRELWTGLAEAISVKTDRVKMQKKAAKVVRSILKRLPKK